MVGWFGLVTCYYSYYDYYSLPGLLGRTSRGLAGWVCASDRVALLTQASESERHKRVGGRQRERERDAAGFFRLLPLVLPRGGWVSRSTRRRRRRRGNTAAAQGSGDGAGVGGGEDWAQRDYRTSDASFSFFLRSIR